MSPPRAPSRDARDEAAAVERAALRRLGVMAHKAPIDELFAAMAEASGRIVDADGVVRRDSAFVGRFDPDGMMTIVASRGPGDGSFERARVGSRWPLTGDGANAEVFRTGRPARLEGRFRPDGPVGRYLREVGLRSAVAVPIVVDGRLWGSAFVGSTDDRLPAGTENRLAGFAELAATAIASAQRHAEARRLADQQAALRRVAVLVAEGREPVEVCAAVVAEVGVLCGAYRTGMTRYDLPDTVSAHVLWRADGEHEDMGGRWPIAGRNVDTILIDTGRPVRIDDWSLMEGEVANVVRERMRPGSSVAAPIVVGGRLWGAVHVHSREGERLPEDTEQRVVAFTGLVATALANAAARAEVDRLAEEQSVMRRLATAVARRPPLGEVLDLVVAELLGLLDVEDARIVRVEERTATVMAARGVLAERYGAGWTGPLEPRAVITTIAETGRPARSATYEGDGVVLGARSRSSGVRSAVGVPVTVRGRTWGVLLVLTVQPGVLTDAADGVLAQAAELVAAAVRNHDVHRRLAASRERIVTAADEARRRVERDLHDGAQQRLVALALELRSADRLSGEAVTAVAAEVRAVVDDLRDLARGLRPAALAEGGLEGALAALARRSATPVRLRTAGLAAALDGVLEITAYYVVAEALTNVAKHARASAAEVVVEARPEAVTVHVVDDGVGGADPGAGSGLGGIRDRVEAIGGAMVVDSLPGAGTRLSVSLPRDLRADPSVG